MNDPRPFLLVRAHPVAEAVDRFVPWFLGVHLKDVAKIPGIVRIVHGKTAGGTYLGIYTFADAEAVGGALSSPQAAYARGTWEQWAPYLEELQIEVFAQLYPLPIYQSAS